MCTYICTPYEIIISVELEDESMELMTLLVKEMHDLREELAHIEAQIEVCL